MTRLLLLLVTFGTFSTLFSQETDYSEEELAVKQTIDQLFLGMQKADSAMIRGAFHPSNRLMTCYIGRDGIGHLAEDSLIDFLNAVAGANENEWNEKITSCAITIDLNLAQVWTTYEFYLGDKFSHCGVNAFQLVKEEIGWKIIQLTDTRRMDDCGK